MTSQILQAELSNLVQESKRKNSDLRNAAENSLNELKALPSTSDSQLVADLIRKPNFVNPFILACHSRHARLAGIGVVCLQRLVASRALPAGRLKDVLDGLRETTTFGLDVQLKILQTLPLLLQNFPEDLNGELLANALEVCATLQGSKIAAVSSTAAATLQQLVVFIFEKVASEDAKKEDIPSVASLTIDSTTVSVGSAAYDAVRVLDDLCRLVEGEKLVFLRIKSLAPTFVLELIESILTSNDETLPHHPELVHVLRTRLMPLALRYFSERQNFSLTVRVARVLLLLFKGYLTILPDECEMALGLINHLIDPDATTLWKRVLCMEIFRGLHSEPGLIRLIYFLFDEQKERKDIVRDHMASLVRLAAEKPTLIGVSNKSTMPIGQGYSRDTTTEDQITLEAGGLAGVIGTPVTSADSNVFGISNEWSVVRTAYMDLLDKSDAPYPPETYIYSLVLNCISYFSEGLAKFILPLTVPESRNKRRNRAAAPSDQEEKTTDSDQIPTSSTGKRRAGSNAKKSSIPINPLELKSHPQFAGIQAAAGMLDTCWPAVLATCSTFLYAALDGEFYHNLVRSFQKLTHVAGLLRLSTPRDAFLTTLGKAAVPADISTAGSMTNLTDTKNSIDVDNGLLTAEARSPTESRKSSFDISPASLSARNLLCLRALLNLGIALGPTLDFVAWTIILETLQHAELVMNASTVVTKETSSTSQNGESNIATTTDIPKANMGSEILAVQTAVTKLFEGTGDYPNSSFKNVLTALLHLSGDTKEGMADAGTENLGPAPRSPQRNSGRLHQNKRSVSITLGKSRMHDDELRFVLDKTSNLTKANIQRLSSPTDEEEIWGILVSNLTTITRNDEISSTLRLKAGETLNNTIIRSMKLGNSEDVSARNDVQLRGLEALRLQITSLYDSKPRTRLTLRTPDFEVHELALETLKSVLEQCGESLVAGWDLVFELISSAFEHSPLGEEKVDSAESAKQTAERSSRSLRARSSRLVRIAFDSLQLVASDFLSLLPASCLLALVETFSKFAVQTEDFNISLTTTSFFWNVSDFLQRKASVFSIEDQIDVSSNEDALVKLARDEDESLSRDALWLLLLLRIVDLTIDSRSEIRNSAIQTLLRIFDAYGQQLSPKAWHLCLNRILFVMVEGIQVKVLNIPALSKDVASDGSKAWIETTVVMTKGFTDLLANFFEPIHRYSDFDASWQRLLHCFATMIKAGLLELSEAIFSSLASILARVVDSGDLGSKALQPAWDLWVNGHPVVATESPDLENPNQDALLAYLHSFQQIYRLRRSDFSDGDIGRILMNLRSTAWDSISSRYSMDIDHLSSVQKLTIECLESICLDMDDSQPKIVLCLADFGDCALTKWSPEKDKSRSTFVAFSKASMDLLSWYIVERGIKRDIFFNGSLTAALEHLANPIVQKYDWNGRDRGALLWKKATTASLKILEVAIPYVEKHMPDADQEKISQFWECVVDITRGIVSANIPPNLPLSAVQSDEEFDVESFSRIRALIIPSLGSPLIPDRIRRDFACALFQSSLIHPPHRGDCPAGAIKGEPLQGLYEVRMGRTYDPPPTPRAGLAYVLIDTLFDLTSAHSNTAAAAPSETATATARIHLAKAAAPYLILRSAIALKSYIADQPLRGLMPQPTSSRKELLHLLDKLVQLKSEPAAIPDAPGEKANTRARFRKHLSWMFPLIVEGLQVAGKESDDGKALGALGRVLEEVEGRRGDDENEDENEPEN